MHQSTSTSTKKLTINIVSETPFYPKGHGVHTAFVEMVEAYKKLGHKVLINSDEKTDITHCHTIGFYSLKKIKKNPGRVAISAHVIPDSFVGSLVGAKLWLPLSKIYLKYFYNKAKVMVAVSPQVKTELDSWNLKGKVFYIPNSVNMEKFKHDKKLREARRKALGIENDEFVVVNTGQIQPRKGIQTFIDTAKKLPSVKFVWVGGIPMKKFASNYKEMMEIQKNPPKNVIFAGMAPYEDAPSYYSAADALFFPSYQENFPYSVIEAAAAGLPLIMRDLDIYKPIYWDLTIKTNNEEDFSNIIERLSKDKDYWQEWSKKAIELAKKYESITTAKKIIELYKKEILNESEKA